MYARLENLVHGAKLIMRAILQRKHRGGLRKLMAAYSSSESTKMALITAAGTLFAEHGVKAVTTRAIADLAGENIGNIHYHFGGKEGLLDAALDYATSPWSENPFRRMLEEAGRSLETPAGQRQIVEKFIDFIFDSIFSEKRPSWCGSLVFQILHRNLPASGKLYERLRPSIMAFQTLYAKATGEDSAEKAHCWFLTITSAPVLLSIDRITAQKYFPDCKLPPTYVATLKAMCLENALARIGLQKGREEAS